MGLGQRGEISESAENPEPDQELTELALQVVKIWAATSSVKTIRQIIVIWERALKILRAELTDRAQEGAG